MNLVDSSGWLEYFAKGPNAGFFAEAIEQHEQLIVPTLAIYEVFKRVATQRGELPALQAITAMSEGRIVDLTADLAMNAARTSMALRLPMADSVMLATARAHGAVFWTQDSDFAAIDDVRYVERVSD